MPGIVGIISQRPPDECECLVASMVRSMEHESFYTSGTHSTPELGIYGGWVAHEGSFAADQVFHNEQRDIALIFSGECFVEGDTRTQLKQKGHELGEAAADRLIHLYEEEGEQFFEKLNGLFSGLLIDKRHRRALLFNDRYGMERIYWFETKDAMYFASEAKALLHVCPELRAFDEEGVAQFLTFGCTLEGQTLFRGVRLLPGGSLWSFQNGSCRKQKYFTPTNWESQPTFSVEAFESTFQETFKRILPRYFESDSGIGISLTGGLDTRMIMACRPKSGQQPLCYTFAGTKGETVDARLARRVAETCGLDHQLLRIGSDFFSKFGSYADRSVYTTDGCFGILGAHEIYLHEQARRLARVRVTGNFGSEILRSMSTFKPIGLAPELVNGDFSQSLYPSVGTPSGAGEHPVTFAAFKEIPWNLFGGLVAGRSQVTFRTPYLDNDIVALAFQAPASARTSPISALRLVKNCNPALSEIPTDRGHRGDSVGIGGAMRHFFSEAAFKFEYHSNEGLPHWLSPVDSVIQRLNSAAGTILGMHKYLHYRSWLRKELASYLQDVLTTVQAANNPFWNSNFLGQMALAHINGRKNYVREINAVLTLEAVERLIIRGASENQAKPAEPRCLSQTQIA